MRVWISVWCCEVDRVRDWRVGKSEVVCGGVVCNFANDAGRCGSVTMGGVVCKMWLIRQS